MNTFFFLCTLVCGISGKIQGNVIDEATREPIPGADVVVTNTQMGAATDENGNFFILNVPPGVYTVEVSFIGYQSKYIEKVIVEIDRTVRLNVILTETMIEIPPVIVTSEMPSVTKDMVGTTYIVRETELAALPIDYTIDLVSFQPGVAHSDTAIHVRGGRANEVQYMIDNVSIIDPQTGELAINISKGVVNEIIFLPGGFDAEYGRAMSGVINLISLSPADNLHMRAYAKTEEIMPFYYNFGYENYQSTIHLPVSRRFKGLVSFDIMHTDDWNPKLFILPHKNRNDYSTYGKLLFAPSGAFNIVMSGALSRLQFDRYASDWVYYLDHYRSDMRKGDLEVVSINFLPDSRKFFNLTMSRLYTKRTYGPRENIEYGLIEDFSFRDYNSLAWPSASERNPFGARYPDIICEGDYPEFQDKESHVLKSHVSSTIQLHMYHEVKVGFEYAWHGLDNFTYFVSDSQHQLIDEYYYEPVEYAVYLQENIDYKGLYAKLGCRFDHFSSGISDIEPHEAISPRFGISFMVTEKFLFRANVGRFVQPPLYDQMYGNYNLLPFPSYIEDVPLIGNPSLGPEKTISYEIGLQGEIQQNLILTINAFFKDVSDLIGTRLVPTLPQNYVEYQNIEYANVRGLEAIWDFATSFYTGKISYTLSWAKGTSSYAEEVYMRYYYNNPDYDTSITPEAREYYLDFDQRHRIFVQGTVKLPWQTQMHLFGYIGDGFPYTPPGPEGKTEERNALRLEFQRQIDCVISKSFTLGKFKLSANFEIINVLDARYQISPHYPLIPLEDISQADFDHPAPFIDLTRPYYNPAADIDHDGMVTPSEEYTAFYELIKASDDWVNANSAPRRGRIGVTLSFQ